MSGKQTGWIYTTLPIACIVSPLVAGQLADRYWNLEWILAGAHLLAAVPMFVAVRQKTFWGLFFTMLGWSICFAGTMPLVNSVLFRYDVDGSCAGKVFIWAPVAWALVGYCLSGWRALRKGESDGTDALIFSALLGLAMVGCCLLLPRTPPTLQGGKWFYEEWRDLWDNLPNQVEFSLFLVTSLFVAGTMQFYFLGSGQYMMDRGLSGKAVPGSMAMAQAVQAIATWFALGLALTSLGYKWTFVLGAASWCLLYLIYVAGLPRMVLIPAQALHGIAYVMFIIVGQIFSNDIAKAVAATTGKEFLSSMQGLIFAATTGVGLFLGTQLAGFAMDKNQDPASGKFQWPKIWVIPFAITLAGTLIFATAFQGKVPEKKAKAAVAAATK